MTNKGEKIGAALAKAVKATTGITSASIGAKMFRTNIKDVPKVEGLKRDDGWIDMQVQFLIDKKSAGADNVVGWTVLKPGASHERHLHRNCDEFFIVLKGQGHIISEKGLEPSVQGDVVYSPRGVWHGFNNTSNEDVVLVWGWMGAGSIEASGYEKSSGGAQSVSATLKDPRIAGGMRAQMALRKQKLDEGARQIGWKVGLGAPAMQVKCRLTAPIVGFLLDRAELESGATVSLAGWAKPVAEAEIAVYMGRDLPAGATRDETRRSIAAIGPAIELADAAGAMDDIEAVLAGDIFQRHVLLGPRDIMREGARLDGLTGRVTRSGQDVPLPLHLQTNIGDIIDIVRHVADVAAAVAEGLRAGQLIITGSLTAPMFLEAGERSVDFELKPIGGVSVRFS